MRQLLEAQGEELRSITAARVELPPLPSRGVAGKEVQVKVIRDLEKLPVDGIYLSKGYAFVDVTHHAYALAILRMMNNNPFYSYLAVGGNGHVNSRLDLKALRRNNNASTELANIHRLIVDFTIESQKVLKKLEARRQRLVENAARRKKSEESKESDINEEEKNSKAKKDHDKMKSKMSRGKRQREKKRLRKERAAKGLPPLPEEKEDTTLASSSLSISMKLKKKQKENQNKLLQSQQGQGQKRKREEMQTINNPKKGMQVTDDVNLVESKKN